jgi:UDP-2,3-diacylglucosamine pyrophosphatase LpxH
MENNITELLLNCEGKGIAPTYVVNQQTYRGQKSPFFHHSLPERTEPVKYNSEGEEIFVVSDLHIASGRNSIGIYKGTENFFADDSFYRFLEYAHRTKETPKAILIINGDIFDFLRVTDFPGKVKKVRPIKKLKRLLKFNPVKKAKEPPDFIVNDEYQEWMEELKKIGIKKTRDELENSISSKEKIYGLKTNDYKTIYKLIKIKKGHPVFFEALSLWLSRGNKIVILKGNHDLEIYWPAVRNYLRLILAEGIKQVDENKNLENILNEILPKITFIDDGVVIDQDFYLEHGHRFDKFTFVLDDPVFKNSGEISIPFGSFFNRYIINRVELFFPFIDNVKPSSNILPLLMKENFSLGIKVLFQQVPLLLRILTTNFRYTWFMLNRVVWFFLALIAPFIIILIFDSSIYSRIIHELMNINSATGFAAFLFDQAKNLGLVLLSFFLARIVAWFQLEEPSSLDTYAQVIFEKSNYRIITMGHTHNPGEYLFENRCRFYNTGTWIPVIETSTADIREDKTYTFLHLIRDSNGKLQPSNDGLLQRWDDESGSSEPQILIERK